MHVRGRGIPPARNYDLHGNAPDQSDVAVLLIESDGVASIDRAANRRALAQMRTLLAADVRPSRTVILRRAVSARGRAGAG